MTNFNKIKITALAAFCFLGIKRQIKIFNKIINKTSKNINKSAKKITKIIK